MKTKKSDPKRAKKHLDRLREMIAKDPSPIFKMSKEDVIKQLRKTRNMRQLLLRGKLKAKGEFLIMCIAHNLKKMAKWMTPIGDNPVLQPMQA